MGLLLIIGRILMWNRNRLNFFCSIVFGPHSDN